MVSCSHDTLSSFSNCKTINYYILHTKGSFPISGGRRKHSDSPCAVLMAEIRMSGKAERGEEHLTYDSHCLTQDLPQHPKHKFLLEQC